MHLVTGRTPEEAYDLSTNEVTTALRTNEMSAQHNLRESQRLLLKEILCFPEELVEHTNAMAAALGHTQQVKSRIPAIIRLDPIKTLKTKPVQDKNVVLAHCASTEVTCAKVVDHGPVNASSGVPDFIVASNPIELRSSKIKIIALPMLGDRSTMMEQLVTKYFSNWFDVRDLIPQLRKEVGPSRMRRKICLAVHSDAVERREARLLRKLEKKILGGSSEVAVRKKLDVSWLLVAFS